MPVEIRIMTYNVHSCCGRDRKASPAAIADIIAAIGADIAALQEVDVGLSRTGFIDQAQAIAGQLEMSCCFSPSWWLEEGQYGNAILSKYPLSLRKAEGLPTLERTADIEPRGAIWAETEIGKGKAQVFNTHLGLRKKERGLQINRLVGPEWLGHSDCRQPIIFCGDLNALPNSSVVKRLRERFMDTQLFDKKNRPKKTYPSLYPLMRLDYIFVSHDIEVRKVSVPRSPSAVRASDHLPLVVDVALPDRELP